MRLRPEGVELVGQALGAWLVVGKAVSVVLGGRSTYEYPCLCAWCGVEVKVLRANLVHEKALGCKRCGNMSAEKRAAILDARNNRHEH